MRILLVEDDIQLCEAVTFHLEESGYLVDTCHDGQEALLWTQQKAHDVIILDRMLPGLDGLSVLRDMRKRGDSTPVLVLTALDGIGERVAGLDAGADDYLIKPFAVEELLARVRSLGRRPAGYAGSELLTYGDASLDTERHVLSCGSVCVSLSGRESQLFEVMLRNPAQTLTRQTLMARVWGADGDVEDGNLDNYIHFLRKRLRAVGSRLRIETIRGVGYMIKQQEE